MSEESKYRILLEISKITQSWMDGHKRYVYELVKQLAKQKDPEVHIDFYIDGAILSSAEILLTFEEKPKLGSGSTDIPKPNDFCGSHVTKAWK